jgi:hypothetical protein
MYYELTDHFEVAADIDRCWQFFGSADLPLITPPWLNFSIAMPTPCSVAAVLLRTARRNSASLHARSDQRRRLTVRTAAIDLTPVVSVC